MTIQVQTSMGKIKVVAPFTVSSKLKKEIADAVRSAVEEKDESLPIENLLRKMKEKDPVIGTPQGALLAYKSSRGWTQIELAERSGISQADLSKMLSGKRSIGAISAKKLGRAFSVDYRKFL